MNSSGLLTCNDVFFAGGKQSADDSRCEGCIFWRNEVGNYAT